jgi:hypothetical protein
VYFEGNLLDPTHQNVLAASVTRAEEGLDDEFGRDEGAAIG